MKEVITLRLPNELKETLTKEENALVDTYMQIGIAVLRDPTTGEPLKPQIPIYAKSKAVVQSSGHTQGEQKLLTDVAGVFVDIFRKYSNEIKTLNQRRTNNGQEMQ